MIEDILETRKLIQFL